MRHLISILTEQINIQVEKYRTNIVRLEGFDNPLLYKAICKNIISNEKIDRLIPKLSKEKYFEFCNEHNETWESALEFLHKGDNNTYSDELTEEYMEKSYVDYNNAMTKWRNESASYTDGKTVLILLMGTEAVPDSGGLVDTSFSISPKKIIYDLQHDYSKWFDDVLKANSLEDLEVKKAINTLYKAIFSIINIDLIRFSDFIDSLDDISFVSGQDLINYICETLNVTWNIPSIKDNKCIPKTQNLAKGTMKNAKIVLDGINFINRADDIPSRSNLNKIEMKFDEFAKNNNVDYSLSFPLDEAIFDNYDSFKDCVIEFVTGRNVDANRSQLMKIDYSYVYRILGTPLKGPEPGEKVVVVSGSPLEAYIKMISNAIQKYKECSGKNPEMISFKVDGISLSDCNDEQKEDSFVKICNYMGGILKFLDDTGLEISDQNLSLLYDQDLDPFDFSNVESVIQKIKCSGKWGAPCKIFYTLDLGDKKFKYKWAFSANASWLNAFSYLGIVLLRGGDSYSLPTLAICQNIQDYLNCESEDEFYAQLSQMREKVLFEEHRQELRKYFNETEFMAQFDSLCTEFKDFAYGLTQRGLFNSLENLRRVVQVYSDMLNNVYQHFDSLNDDQREKLPLLVNSFVITSNENILSNSEMKEVLVPAYNPVLLEKIDAKILFIREGFKEILEKFTYNSKDYEQEISELIQLSSITSAMDTINQSGANYLICHNMWEYYGVYYGSLYDSETISGNSFGNSIVSDDEDSSAMLRVTPMSNIVVRNVLDYIRTFPARIDGVNIAFVGPDDMQHIVAAIHTIANHFEKQETAATINIEIISINSKKNSTSYLKRWLDSYFSDEKVVSVNTYLKNIVIKTKDDIDAIRPMIKDFDLCFNYNVLDTIGIDFEPGVNEKIDKDMIKFPMTFTPDTIAATHGQSRKICISQFQFLASKAQTQISNVMGHPYSVKNIFKAFKKLEMSEMATKLVEISHECCKWVVCIDPAIDRHMLETEKSKIIGFTTGEGSYGELNVTVSARKDLLKDIKSMLKKRITEKFSNWNEDRLQAASDYCVDYLSGFMDGSRILKALNPYDYEIHSFLAYMLTLQMLNMTQKNDGYILRTLISLDSYKHWFEEDDYLNLDNKRPDFMLLEIPNTSDNLDPDKKLNLNVKIIECKMGFKSESHIQKAQTQLEKGLRTMIVNWDPESKVIMHRYWLNQLYRAIIFTQLNLENTTKEYSIIREKMYGILQGNFDIKWSGDVFAFWLDSNSEKPEEWEFESTILSGIENVQIEPLKCHNCGQMFIQKMLLPPEKRTETFEFNFLEEPQLGESDDENENIIMESNDEEDEKNIPTPKEIYVPFLKHLGDGLEHSRKEDLIWFSNKFGINNTLKNDIYKSNGNPKWEIVFDSVITDFRRDYQLLENSQLGIYHLNELGMAVFERISEYNPEQPFSRFVVEVKKSKEENDDEPKEKENKTDEKDDSLIISTDDAKEDIVPEQKSLEEVRLLLGTDIRSGEKYYWEFGNKNLNNRHLLINGNSGCGKTYCIQTLLMEAAIQGISSVVFDYTGGFANGKLDPIFKETLGQKIVQRVVKIKKIPVNPFEKNEIQIDEDIFVPEENADVADKIAEIFKAVYDLGDQQKSAVYSAVLNGLKIHGDLMSFPIMVEELENMGTNYAKSVISKIQAFSDFNPFAADDSFSWSAIRDSDGMVYVFQLAGYGRDIQILLTELLLWDIWNFCVKSGDETKPFILVMDEAQNLSHGDKSPSAKILTEGRKFGISGWYATQFMKPQLSDDEIQRLQQAGQKLYFCPPDDGVTTVAKNIDITSQGAKEWAERLTKLKKGECVTCGNMVRNGKWTKYEPKVIKVTSLQERINNE